MMIYIETQVAILRIRIGKKGAAPLKIQVACDARGQTLQSDFAHTLYMKVPGVVGLNCWSLTRLNCLVELNLRNSEKILSSQPHIDWLTNASGILRPNLHLDYGRRNLPTRRTIATLHWCKARKKWGPCYGAKARYTKSHLFPASPWLGTSTTLALTGRSTDVILKRTKERRTLSAM